MNKLKNELLIKSQGEKIFSFFSPARINLIGEHIDYVGGLVIPAAIDIGICAYACKSKNIEIKSINFSNEWKIIKNFYESIKYQKSNGFMNFVFGIIKELKHNIKQGQGFKLILKSNIPIASGLSSSAAFGMLIIEVFCELYDIKISNIEKTKLFRRVENNFIGVNSGIMDQFAIKFGKVDNFILLNTNTLDYKYVESNPIDYKFILISSNKNRTLVSSKYNERIYELKKISKIINYDFEKLSNITNIKILDQIPSNTLKNRLKHIITENNRVKKIANNLKSMKGAEIGEILNQSHNSLKNNYEVSCEELDFIHNKMNELKEVFGSRMIGGGFGGCILLVVKKDFNKEKIKFNMEYKNKFNISFDIFDFKISDGLRCLDD